MRLALVSELDARGSGYGSIAAGLVAEMERRGHEMLFLAFDYQGQEHAFKAAVVPTDNRTFPRHVQAAKISFAPDAWIVLYDLTAHEMFAWMQRTIDAPYVGIWPIEADPLQHPSPWSAVIDTMDVALCESRFGTKLCHNVGLTNVRYFPVGIDLDHWHRPSPEERGKARADWNVADRFVVLTVCDNHERKNLPAMMAAFALATGRYVEWPPESGAMREVEAPIDNGYFIINTKRRPSRIGYDVSALAETFGIANDTLILQHELRGGMDAEGLRSLYWAADAFLLLSTAEGLGLPILEAMACGVPCVAGDWTGTGESLADGRGFAVPSEYSYIDPFGNQYRRRADVVKAADALVAISQSGAACQVEKASAYVGEMTWAQAGAILEDALTEAVERRKV